MMQTSPAASCPAVLNGLMTTISYPDPRALDRNERMRTARKLLRYPQGTPLSLAQRAAINGHLTSGYCTTWVNSPGAVSSDEHEHCGAGFPASIVYQPDSAAERRARDTDGGPRIRRGHVRRRRREHETKLPYDNVGVQYGIKTLQEGVISPRSSYA